MGQFYFLDYHIRREVIPASITKAIKWFIQATDDGYVADHPGVIRDLAALSDKYMDMDEDYIDEEQLDEGLKLCFLAAIHGHCDSQFNLAKRLLNGRYLEVNEEEAARWVKLAARGGDIEATVKERDPDAQFTLGRAYEKGWGVPQDEGKAIKLYTSAAMQHHRGALSELIHRYELGLGVEKDLDKAEELFHAKLINLIKTTA